MNPDQRRRQQLTARLDVERRLTLVERDVDRLLDPETGIYAKLDSMSDRLRGWAIAILTGLIGALLLEVVQLATRGHGG
jgi:hypothetical protein